MNIKEVREYIEDLKQAIDNIEYLIEASNYIKASVEVANTHEAIEGLAQVLIPFVNEQFENMKLETNV